MAMNYQKLKTTLMGLYGVTATELDNGLKGVPYSVYCVKSFFLHQGEWLAADTVKIGKSSSVANRVRIYGQSGSDVRLLWNIDCVNADFATNLENAVHQIAQPSHVKLTHAREMFEMDIITAYSFLDELEEKFNLKHNNQVKRINRYTPKRMEVYEVDTQSAKDIPIGVKPTVLQKKFAEFFEELPQ
jgi:hypothetical protein